MANNANLPMRWKLRRNFWGAFFRLKFKGNKPTTIPVPVDIKRMIRSIPLSAYYPSIPISNILVADHVPRDERSRLKKLFVRFQIKLNRRFPQMQAGLPPIDGDGDAALAQAYTEAYTKLFPAPVLPDEMRPDDLSKLLGALAVMGPFAGYLELKDGSLQWDLRELSRYEHHPNLVELGVRVRFDVDDQTGTLAASEIESALGVSKPGDPQWLRAAGLALCAASNHTSLVRHFNWVHLACGGPFAVATRNQLAHDHPLRRLLWPHMFGTQYSNDVVTEVQMDAEGDFPNIFSFTFQGMCKLFAETYDQFDIVQINPPKDAARRALRSKGFATPTQDNLESVYGVIYDHTSRYISHYYRDDGELRADKDVRCWLDELERLMPNGIGSLVGDPPSRAELAEITATFIYLGCVQHEVMGTNLWNYQLWTHKIPVRIDENETRQPLDIYQRLVNANFNLNVSRARLMQDFSYLATDPAGASMFKEFLSELSALDTKLASPTPLPWQIAPRILEANMNA